MFFSPCSCTFFLVLCASSSPYQENVSDYGLLYKYESVLYPQPNLKMCPINPNTAFNSTRVTTAVVYFEANYKKYFWIK